MAKLKATPKTYADAVKVLGNRESLKLGNNTWLERTHPSIIAVRLHNTHIVRFWADGAITLNTGGWYKVTTKDRFNEFINGRVWQKNYAWFYSTPEGVTIEFTEGMNIAPKSHFNIAPKSHMVSEVIADKPDFTVRHEGTISILSAHTDNARVWAEAHFPEDVQRWVNGYVIENRYIGDILYGIVEDGLTVEER